MEKKKSKAFLIVLLPVLGVFIFSLVKIGMPMLEYYQGEQEYEKLQDYVSFSQTEEASKEAGMPVDFDALKGVNPDTIGWIRLDSMEISYPIVQGEDNDYYLKHTFQKEENPCGSIFVEIENAPDFSDENTFVYGHNMKNKSMFAKLNWFQEEDTYRDSPGFLIYTPEGVLRYEIYSCHVAKLGSEAFHYQFEEAGEYAEWQAKMKADSLYDTKVTPEPSQKTVTLMTCTAAGSNYRCLVHGVLTEDGRE